MGYRPLMAMRLVPRRGKTNSDPLIEIAWHGRRGMTIVKDLESEELPPLRKPTRVALRKRRSVA
jgi:hypothetical protein